MKTLKVNIPNREYDIKIKKGLLEKAGELLLEVANPCKAVVISDANVAPLYAEKLLRSLKNSGVTPFLATIPSGEGSKSLECLKFLYTELLKEKITRSDIIIALGGGVTGDLAGFCAATLLRGIPFVQIPTTLLAQVDSSVGGKVAVNLPEGKNLVGAFYQPKMVIIDPDTLKTLPDETFSDGMAEVIKYGVILDEKFLKTLEDASSRDKIFEIIEDVIYTSCNLKRTIVEEDEEDKGKRMILNFGHTFGHAIEKEYNFEKYTHGQAVACGMVMAAEYGEKMGLTESGTSDRIRKLVSAFNLPEDIPISKKALIDGIMLDKKSKGNLISLVIPQKIGKVSIIDTKKDSIWTN